MFNTYVILYYIVFNIFNTLNDFANVICIRIFREAKSAKCVEIKLKKKKMLK